MFPVIVYGQRNRGLDVGLDAGWLRMLYWERKVTGALAKWRNDSHHQTLLINSFIHSFIHSSVSHDRSTASSNTGSHRVRSSASSSNFQYPPFSLRASTSCLHLLPRVTVTSILLSVFPSITCVRRQFLHNIWPIQLAFLLLMFAGYSCPRWLFVTLLHFSHDRFSWSPSFSSTTFHYFTGIPDLSEVSSYSYATNIVLY